MAFYIDPKDVNLQDAAGMQLVELIRRLSADSGDTGAEPLIVNEMPDEDSGNSYLDKTWQEIYEAVNAGKNVYLTWDDGDPETIFMPRLALALISAEWDAGGSWPSPYVVRFCDVESPDSFTFGTTSADGYPTYGSD